MKEIVKFNGSTWEVIKRYQLTKEFMKAHQLFFKNRITLRCIESGNPALIGQVVNVAEAQTREV